MVSAMSKWLFRGVLLAALFVLVRALIGFAKLEWPTHGSPMRWIGLLVVVLVSLAVAFADGREDRRRYPDPEDGADLTVVWLQTAAVAGIVAAVAAWLVDRLPRFDLDDNTVFFELTSGAAWTLLLVFISAMAGVGIGRLVAGRKLRATSA